MFQHSSRINIDFGYVSRPPVIQFPSHKTVHVRLKIWLSTQAHSDGQTYKDLNKRIINLLQRKYRTLRCLGKLSSSNKKCFNYDGKANQQNNKFLQIMKIYIMSVTVKMIEDYDYKKQMMKSQRFYLRFYLTIEKAMKLNKDIYGGKRTKDNSEYRYEHPVRIAGMTEEIRSISIGNYHLTWLVGILHDAKQDNLLLYSQSIDEVLDDLLPQQAQTVIRYINDLTSDKTLSKGQQKKEQVSKMRKLELIPSFIKIFDKYDNCSRFKKDPCGKSKQELRGYYAVGYLCYYQGMKRFNQIKTYLSPTIRNFFEEIERQLGGLQKITQYAQQYYKI